MIPRHHRGGRRGGAAVLLIAALLLLGGCRVDTSVSVIDTGRGHGSVSVTATFDPAALQALGGLSGLARQLSVSDLTAAGWTVAGPAEAQGGGAVVTVSHGYSSPAEAERLLAEIAGSGPAGKRPFQLTLRSQRGFLRVRESLSGRVDLRCGLACFGDQGLKSALGNSNGVDPAPLLNGEQPSQVFEFSLSARMPGSLRSDDAASRTGSLLSWPAPMGRVTQISAESESLNTPNVVLFSVLAGLIILVSSSVLFVRRRRRKRRHARRHRIWPFGKRSKSRET